MNGFNNPTIEFFKGLRANRAAILICLALWAVFAPSCHIPLSRQRPVPLAGNNVIRVRLQRSCDNFKISARSVMSFSSDRREEITVSGRFDQKITRLRNEWRINGKSVFSPYLIISSYSGTRLLNLSGRHYRGKIILLPNDGSDTEFSVDNHLPLEQYLAGVLAKELIPSWHEETFKAQAIVARTYALYEMTHGGLGRDFDVFDDQSSQIYGGADAETYRSVTAVNDTARMVLATGQAGQYEIFKAFFSSTCGGVTNPVRALVNMPNAPEALSGGIVCDDCHNAPKHDWPEVKIPRHEVFTALVKSYPQLKKLDALEEITVEESTVWGRAIWVDLKGFNGEHDRIRAEDLRLVLLRHGPTQAKKLYSMNCRIKTEGNYIIFQNGHGHGHGVGMCQYGAEAKARRGKKYYEILYAYYPGAVITRMAE